MSVTLEIPLGNDTYKKVEIKVRCGFCDELLDWPNLEQSQEYREENTLIVKHKCGGD